MRWTGHGEELFRHDQWRIGVVEAPIHAFLDPGFRPQVRWLPAPRRRGYYADPFGWIGPAGLEIVCEAWEAATGCGRLVHLGLDGAAQPLQGFPRGVHASYPFLVEGGSPLFAGVAPVGRSEGALRSPAGDARWRLGHLHAAANGGERLCIPETWEAGEVRLYKMVGTNDWRPEATLLPGVAGVDATVFCHGDRWWLAATDHAIAPFDELLFWHAPALRGPWTPHRRQPVKRDLGSARPAGTPFWHAGALYRPAQDCRRTYGGAVVIHRIVRLTPDEFEEEPVARVEPRPEWPWRGGVHTLSAAGNFTLLDAKRTVFLPAAFRRVLLRKLRRALRGPRP